MNNLHISLTPYLNESRVVKQTNSLISHSLVTKIFILCLHSEGLNENEKQGEDIEIWRIRLRTRNLPKSPLFHFMKYIEFFFKAIIFAKNKNIDIVNVHLLALLPLGVIIKYITKSKLVYDAHELETEVEGLKGLRKFLSKIVEKFLIRQADLTIVVGKEIERWYLKEYGKIPIVTVMNCPVYQHIKKTDLLRQELKIPRRYKIVLYQGGFGTARGIQLLLEAFKNKDIQGEFAIVFMGYGEYESEIKVASTQHSNIFFKPAVDPSIVLNYTSSADIGISLIQDSNLSDHYCLPNKLFEFIMARLPVVISNLPEMTDIVKKYDIGRVLNKWSAIELVHLLQNIDLTSFSEEVKVNLRIASSVLSWEEQEKEMIKGYIKYIIKCT